MFLRFCLDLRAATFFFSSSNYSLSNYFVFKTYSKNDFASKLAWLLISIGPYWLLTFWFKLSLIFSISEPWPPPRIISSSPISPNELSYSSFFFILSISESNFWETSWILWTSFSSGLPNSTLPFLLLIISLYNFFMFYSSAFKELTKSRWFFFLLWAYLWYMLIILLRSLIYLINWSLSLMVSRSVLYPTDYALSLIKGSSISDLSDFSRWRVAAIFKSYCSWSFWFSLILF